MKQTISIFAVLALVLLLSENAFSQVSPNINANAEVVTSLSANQDQQLDFAYISDTWTSGNEPTIDPSDGSTSGSGFEDASNAQVGFVGVSGTGGQTVDVTVAGQFTIDNGTDNITFTPNYNWTTDNLSGGESSWTASGSNTTSDFSMTLDGDGTNTILVAGQLEAASSLSEGSYTGSSSITISYQ
jgi:hypothetical protein